MTSNEQDSGASSASSGGTAGTTPGSSSTSTATNTIPAAFAATGAQVDLWDSGWPSGRYYWTVVPVREVPSLSGAMQYIDAEVPQDACAAGRVAAFGKASQPTAASASTPYISGLSPSGDLVAAQTARPAFYRAALIAWEPALGATGYEVQWSKTKYPWKSASTTPTYTAATSMLLEGLTPGVWYYRIRGIDPYVPGPVKQMTWSTPAPGHDRQAEVPRRARRDDQAGQEVASSRLSLRRRRACSAPRPSAARTRNGAPTIRT